MQYQLIEDKTKSPDPLRKEKKKKDQAYVFKNEYELVRLRHKGNLDPWRLSWIGGSRFH